VNGSTGVAGILDELVLGNRRFLVDEYFRIQSLENIDAIGDVACQQSESFPRGHPMLAAVALEQARYPAKQLPRRARGLVADSYDCCCDARNEPTKPPSTSRSQPLM